MRTLESLWHGCFWVLTNFLVVSRILNGESPWHWFMYSFGASDHILVLNASILNSVNFGKDEVVIWEVVVHLMDFDFLTVLVSEPTLGIFILNHFDLFNFFIVDTRQINRIVRWYGTKYHEFYAESVPVVDELKLVIVSLIVFGLSFLILKYP